MKVWNFNFFLLLVILFHSPNVFSESDNSSLEVEFNQAYQAYQDNLKENKISEAYKYAKQSYEIGQKLYGEEDINTAVLATNYVAVSVKQGKIEKSIFKVIESAVNYYETEEGPDSKNLVFLYYLKGAVHLKEYKSKRADKMFDKALDISKKHEMYAKTLWDIASVYSATKTAQLNNKNRIKVAGYYEEVADIFKQSNDARNLNARISAAILYAGDNKYFKKAEKNYLEVLSEIEKTDDKNTQYQIHAFLVDLYSRNGKEDMATRHCLETAKIKPLDENLEPKPLFMLYPAYPKSKAIAGIEGWVKVEFVLDKEGKVKETQVVESKGGKDFQKEALKVFKKWRFTPKFIDNEPVDTTLRYTMEFRLSP
ncbi:MAG: energy transducer TonB [Gammaproteobacteria bacterium]|nr:energy transducer TonB [Gammaproteobacteria bacterium]